MIITGANFARIADGIYSFHIEKVRSRVVITFTDSTGGEVFRIEKTVRSKNFRVDLLKEMLILNLLIPNMDDERHRYDVLDVDELIVMVDEHAEEVEREIEEEEKEARKLSEFYDTLFTVVSVDDEEVNGRTLGELKELTRRYLETGEAPEWFKKALQT